MGSVWTRIAGATMLALASLCLAAAPSEEKPATIDYAYLDGDSGHPDRQRVVVVGTHFRADASKKGDCQTRAWIGDKWDDWRNAESISRAKEDEYKFKPGQALGDGDIQTRVMGTDGKFSEPMLLGNGTSYWERFQTSGSPHDCIGKAVQVRWCPEPKPTLGSHICPDTKYALACEKKNDYVVVGVHFKAGSVASVQIEFDYTQIDVQQVGIPSDSVLRRAIVEDDAACPRETKFKDAQPLSSTCKPKEFRCFPLSDVVQPGKKDTAVYFMFKRKTWGSVLSVNNMHISTTMAPVVPLTPSKP